MRCAIFAVAWLAASMGWASAQTLQCPDHIKITRSNGTWKEFRGHDPADSWVCVGTETGAPVKLILNVWPIGMGFPTDPQAIRVKGGVEELKAQISAVITGPVGTKGRWYRLDVALGYFDVPIFTLVHEADEVIMVNGTPHDTIRLRLSGSGGSASDVTTWLDKSLLFSLKRAVGHAQGTYVVSIESQ